MKKKEAGARRRDANSSSSSCSFFFLVFYCLNNRPLSARPRVLKFESSVCVDCTEGTVSKEIVIQEMANEMESAVDALMHIVHSRPGTPPAEDQKPIQAYAKLQGEDFVYYIRTLSVLLGRKTAPYDEVQVDLGTSKIVSRIHARIEYNFVTKSFELTCLGKNGVFIDGKFVAKDSSAVALDTKYVLVFFSFFLLGLGISHPFRCDP